MKTNGTFLKDVVSGLSASPKKLPSKYFYDETGDKLFHYIMNQPEYYLTCVEHEILQNQNAQIFSNIDIQKGLRIIEPGAGDGMKTRLLISHLIGKGFKVIYNPIDISANVLNILCKSMTKIYPQLLCEPIAGDYSDVTDKIAGDDLPKLMLFLGSNIGNYQPDEAINILRNFASALSAGDFFLLGVDLVKDPKRILAAYNDSKGITALFNYNLLARINRELGANFVIENFTHHPVYNQDLQQAESYLVSHKKQFVYIKNADQHFTFQEGEPTHTEISRKYTTASIEQLARLSGFSIIENYFDRQKDFCCSLWRKL